MHMKKIILMLASLVTINVWGQNPPPPPPLDNGSDYDGYPYDGYYYAGGYYGYGGYAGRGRDWNEGVGIAISGVGGVGRR